MAYACKSIPIMGIFTTSIFIFEIRGYSKLYDKVNDCPLGKLSLSAGKFYYATENGKIQELEANWQPLNLPFSFF